MVWHVSDLCVCETWVHLQEKKEKEQQQQLMFLIDCDTVQYCGFDYATRWFSRRFDTPRS